MKRLAFLAAVVWLAVDCKPIPTPVPPPQPDADSSAPLPPQNSPDAAAPARDSSSDLVLSGSTCAQFCAVIDWIGCSEARPTPKGESCEHVCDDVHGFNFKAFEQTVKDATKCRDVECVRRAGVKCGAR
jgi:hypothetical protein